MNDERNISRREFLGKTAALSAVVPFMKLGAKTGPAPTSLTSPKQIKERRACVALLTSMNLKRRAS